MGQFADIRNLVVASDTVTYKGEVFQVWGLTLAHIVHIVREHGEALAPLYDQAKAGNLEASPEAMALGLGDNFTSIAASIIACGMGQPKMADHMQYLSIGVQLDALDKIIRLTLQNEGGMGKVMEIVMRAVEGLASLNPPKT